MQCLWGLQAQGFQFELKGGTSLSKGFGIIHRFSEDIDIRMSRSCRPSPPSTGDWPRPRRFRPTSCAITMTCIACWHWMRSKPSCASLPIRSARRGGFAPVTSKSSLAIRHSSCRTPISASALPTSTARQPRCTTKVSRTSRFCWSGFTSTSMRCKNLITYLLNHHATQAI
ncbi:nucleotidyl transferase AbiEii/AbiGii toxin family protein [Burkholderia guangdongensis]|uniref:nucleotidyl transferase AbiEii/AbiGii toxin family protein n=1 Tax=Burkholderia guangdongensis TaxID=1792500 RepID=UPI003CCD1E25